MTAKVSSDYTNCVVVYPRAPRRYAHVVRTSLSNTAGEAIAKLKDDKAAYILPELYDEVAARWEAIQSEAVN